MANRWLNKLKNDRKLSVELFGSEQPGLKMQFIGTNSFCSLCFIAVIYNIEVQTGDEQIEPLDSPVYMQIYGNTTTTPKLFLESKTASFTKDSTSKFSLSSNNVGEVGRIFSERKMFSCNLFSKIQRIIIGHEGLGKVNDWYLKSVQVQMLSQQEEFVLVKLFVFFKVFFRFFRYLVEKWLSPNLGDQKLFVELSKEKPLAPVGKIQRNR